MGSIFNYSGTTVSTTSILDQQQQPLLWTNPHVSNMVVAARGGRSGVRECIRSCLALLLPSLSLLFLLSSPLPPSPFCFLSYKTHSPSLLKFTFFRLFVQTCCNLLFVFVLKINCISFENDGFPKSQ